ncbi:hypothetical protein [Cognatiyoonia sp. IB215182]|uniref:hypothetical protein n=1 Tax=Cognatiyoonia sp. IB215182 TaxID=3097353 RepID=UPI002A0E1EC3|nr:hypothetical protein [Cognatiyoonia sp. IB215182]MDX8355595.1 hypothetical protein [Cognatiyoonia sp. IB215182]
MDRSLPALRMHGPDSHSEAEFKLIKQTKGMGKMRKLVLPMIQSVDGYINGPGREPLIPEWSSDLDQ